MTRLRLRKLGRDVWATRARIAMMVVAIAVSILAVGAFLSSRAILGREIERNYLETRPASATLHLPGGAGPAAVAAARAQPGVLDATARGSHVTRVKVDGGPERTLVLFAADPADPQRIATVRVEQGVLPPPVGGLLLERTALAYLGVGTGDSVLVYGADGGTVRVNVTGSVHDGGVAPAEQERTVYGYLSLAGLAALGGSVTPTDLKIVVGDGSGPSGDRATVERTAQRVAAALAARGVSVDRIDVPPPLRHPHQGQMVTVGFVLLAFGLTALLLSSVLVATMLGGMLAAQIRQIGAMKAVGAGTGQILAMYLTLAAFIAVVATALAVAPATLLGRLLAGQGGRLLNLDLGSRAVPAWVYAVEVGAGVGVPLLVALVPLLRGSRITVRAAIDDHGADAGSVGGTRAGRWLGRLRGAGRTQSMALRNMFRRRGRLALTLALLATAGSMFLTGLNTAAGWTALAADGIANRAYDLEIQLNRPVPADTLTGVARKVRGVVTAQAWSRQAITATAPAGVDVARVYPDDAHGSFTLLAPPADTTLIDPPLRAGRWLRPDDRNAVVLNTLVPAQHIPGAAVGDTVTLTVDGRATSWRVVGIISDFGSLATAYVTDREYAQVTGHAGEAGMLRIVTDRHDRQRRQAVLAQVEKALADNDIGIEQNIVIDELRAALDGHVLVLADALIAIAVVMGFVGLLGLASTMTTNVTERTREFAVMRAIGATNPAVRGVVTTEGVLIAALSIVLAVLAALPMTKVFGDFIGTRAFAQTLPMQFSGQALLLWTVVALAGAAAATSLAARRAAGLTVREALTTL